jgi:hypothetical protein
MEDQSLFFLFLSFFLSLTMDHEFGSFHTKCPTLLEFSIFSQIDTEWMERDVIRETFSSCCDRFYKPWLCSSVDVPFVPEIFLFHVQTNNERNSHNRKLLYNLPSHDVAFLRATKKNKKKSAIKTIKTIACFLTQFGARESTFVRTSYIFKLTAPIVSDHTSSRYFLVTTGIFASVVLEMWSHSSASKGDQTRVFYILFFFLL